MVLITYEQKLEIKQLMIKNKEIAFKELEKIYKDNTINKIHIRKWNN